MLLIEKLDELLFLMMNNNRNFIQENILIEQIVKIIKNETTENLNILRNEGGQTCLLMACHTQCLEIVQELINKNVNINVDSSSSFSCLHVACICGNYEIAKLLIENNHDVNLTDWSGLSVLAHSSHSVNINMKKIVQLLIDNNVVVDNGALYIYKELNSEIYQMLLKHKNKK
jgi:ankyrin repeat protein